jgi:hypothetical protein
MEYITQLDFILQELSADYKKILKGVNFYPDEAPISTKEEITQKVMEKFTTQEWEINILYHQLFIDKYIKSIDPLIITLDGLIFLRNGGYKQKTILLEAENTRIKTLENDLKKYSLGLMIFTGIVALGTVISAWFFAIEIWKYYNK